MEFMPSALGFSHSASSLAVLQVAARDTCYDSPPGSFCVSSSSSSDPTRDREDDSTHWPARNNQREVSFARCVHRPRKEHSVLVSVLGVSAWRERTKLSSSAPHAGGYVPGGHDDEEVRLREHVAAWHIPGWPTSAGWQSAPDLLAPPPPRHVAPAMRRPVTQQA